MSGAAAGAASTWLRRARAAVEEASSPEARSSLACERHAEAARHADEAIGRAGRAGLDWAEAGLALLAFAGLPESDPLRRRAVRRVAAHLHAAARHREALSLLDGLLRTLTRGDRTGRAEIEGARCAVLARLGRMQEAERSAGAARRAWLAAGRPDAAAQVDVNLGNVLHRSERHREALKAYRRALEVLVDSPARVACAAAWLGVGNTQSFLGDFDEARASFHRAESLFEAAGRDHHRLVAAYNRHYLDLLVAQPQGALDGLAEVRDGFVAAGDAAAAANCDLDLAEVHLHLRTWPEAEEAARRAAERAGGLGLGTERARALVHLARALANRGGARRADEAATLLAEAEAIFTGEGNVAGHAHALVLRAELLLTRGRAAEALEPARRAAADLRRQGLAPREAAALVVEARALLEDAPSAPRRRAASRRLERAAALGARGKWSAVDARTLLGRLAFEDGDWKRARREAAKAARLAEELSGGLSSDRNRAALLGDLHGLFRDGVRYWLTGPGRNTARAFAFAERSRRFSLTRGKRLAPAETRRALESFAAVTGTRGAAVGVLPDLTPSEPQGAEALPVLGLSAIRALLEEGEVLLSYQTASVRDGGAENGAAWLIVATRSSTRALPLTEAGGLAEAVARLTAAAERCALLRASGAPTSAQAAAAETRSAHAAELGRRLLAPVAAELAAATRVLVVPDGPLHGLPFGLLPDPVTGGLLGLGRELLHLPSASWLARRPVRRRRARPILLAGCADEAAPLIDVELRGIARAVRAAGRRVTLLRGPRARFAAFAESVPSAGVVHFAGHGAFRWDGPERSALRFADGWSSVAELEALPFRAELVVLSACRGGAVRGGGGQFAGLTRALLRAGSQAVLASPWTVGDEGAAVLFKAFHGELARTGCAAGALREAARRHPDPVEALSFALVGAPWCSASPRPAG